jgi:hypothetical protein
VKFLLQVSLLDKVSEHKTEENIKWKQFKVDKGAGTIETASSARWSSFDFKLIAIPVQNFSLMSPFIHKMK